MLGWLTNRFKTKPAAIPLPPPEIVVNGTVVSLDAGVFARVVVMGGGTLRKSQYVEIGELTLYDGTVEEVEIVEEDDDGDDDDEAWKRN